MREETKNDIYDLLDLLNKLYSLSFVSDKERLNEVRSEIMSTMSSKSKETAGDNSNNNELYSMDNITKLLCEMKRIRRKDKMVDFLIAIDIKPYDKKLSLEDMRARAIVELIERGMQASNPNATNEGADSDKKAAKKPDKGKKDFMDRWLDFYKQNKNIK